MAESTKRERAFVFGPLEEIQDQLGFKKFEKTWKIAC